MTERPIIFNDAMVLAILDGRKTQTRRPVKGAPPNTCPPTDWAWFKDGSTWWAYDGDYPDEGHYDKYSCPYGHPGDTLWVRECWTYVTSDKSEVCFRCTGSGPVQSTWKWRPSIHMPRWAARIFLRVTDVRVERVRSISEADAKQEACEHEGRVGFVGFQKTWDSIYASKGLGWDANPWVWVVEFERLKGGGE